MIYFSDTSIQTKSLEGEGRTSGWTPFAREADRVGLLKDKFMELYELLSSRSEKSRDDLISLAVFMASNLSSVSTQDENDRFEQLIMSLRIQDKNVSDMIKEVNNAKGSEEIIKLKFDAFRRYAEQFYKQYISVSYRAKLQFSVVNDNQFTIDKALTRMKISKFYWPYTKDIRTSPMVSMQMQDCATLLWLKSRDNQDNVVLVSAERGSGKSCFALTVAAYLSWLHGVPFNLARQVIFQQPVEEVRKIVQTLPPRTTIILDQASAQLSSRRGMRSGNIDLLNEIDFSRVKGRTLIINWHSTDELDKNLRAMATSMVTIPKRGLAVFKSVDHNTKNRGSALTDNKNEIIKDQDQATAIEANTPTTLFTIPYRDLESAKLNTPFANKLWSDYSDYKELAGKQEEYRKENKFIDPRTIANLDFR